ncbi:cupredoxin family copper-binding protein [Yoonia sp. F2084L]|uniref:cupredoxin domain-containing protein n=1 Tax=Yoonia sp. F2084L TaxID=2926419 RepID=UPI001FF24125|nr:cupredoxin family copper-binding protein [Yoonia sp. F2084L]MCK0096999.1 cupredoxin family copper-binding protein [Yoonia sp. F2084L]
MTIKSLLIAGALLVSATVANAADHVVTIKGFAFEPAVLTIAAGDSVTFVNEDGAPHTATANNGAFDTGNLGRGDQSKLTFSAAGTFDYFCSVHPNMTAQIVVQ